MGITHTKDKGDRFNFFLKVRVGGGIAGHDYCCSERERKVTMHAPWCGKHIFPHSSSSPVRLGKKKVHGAESAKVQRNSLRKTIFFGCTLLKGDTTTMLLAWIIHHILLSNKTKQSTRRGVVTNYGWSTNKSMASPNIRVWFCLSSRQIGRLCNISPEICKAALLQ